jgi:parallel beta-helix repeat protein
MKTWTQKILFFAILLSLFPLIHSPVYATNYYVSPQTAGSSDANPGTGTNANQPWKTIQHGLNVITAGDTLYIDGGTYIGQLAFNNKYGTETRPIIIKAMDGKTVIVQSNQYFGIDVHKVSWVVFDGLKFTGGSSHGFSASAVNHLTIQNCESYGNGWAGIFIAGQQNPDPKNPDSLLNGGDTQFDTIKNCKLHDNTHEGIYLKSGYSTEVVSDLTVENNEIYNNGDEAVQNTYWETSAYNPRPPFNTIIRGNYIHNNTGNWGIIDLSGDNLLVEKNRIVNNTGLGISSSLDGGITFQHGHGLTVRNNIFYNNTADDTHGAMFFLENSGGTKIYNNTIVGTNQVGVKVLSPLTQYPNLVKNNIFGQFMYSNVFQISSETTVDHNLFDKSTYDDFGTNSIISDPGFVSVSAQDFHLLSTSKAINSGVNLLPDVTDDLAGITRPQGSAFDIGAYEYSPAISPTPTTTPKPGDSNGDGNVDGQDYVTWLNHYGSSSSGPTNGDFDNNSYVDGKDYVIWLTNYGNRYSIP